MMQRFRFTIRAVALFAAGLCASCAGRPQMTIPVRLNDQNKVLLSTNLGDVVLDTGAPMGLVDEDFAKRHKLKKSGHFETVRDLSGASVDGYMAVIEQPSITAKEPSRSWELC